MRDNFFLAVRNLYFLDASTVLNLYCPAFYASIFLNVLRRYLRVIVPVCTRLLGLHKTKRRITHRIGAAEQAAL